MKLLCKKVIKVLKKKKLTLSVAESCTGGLLSSYITSIPGSSNVFEFGLVTYSNKSKFKILKISKKIIKKYGSVSKECCEHMVKNLNKISKSSLSLSITGIAGPKGYTQNKPVGLVFIGHMKRNKINIYKFLFKNKGRIYIQKATAKKALKLILNS